MGEFSVCLIWPPRYVTARARKQRPIKAPELRWSKQPRGSSDAEDSGMIGGIGGKSQSGRPSAGRTEGSSLGP